MRVPNQGASTPNDPPHAGPNAVSYPGEVADPSFILREDGSYLLREDGARFVRETF